MKKQIAKILSFAFIAAGILAAPIWLHARETSTNASDTATAPAAPASKHGAPFHGTLGDMDTNAMTITVGSRSFQITSTTKITKNGQPAVLSDGVVGQPVSGYYRPADDGTTLNAVTIHFGGAKTAKTTKTTKRKHSDVAMSATNAPASTGN